jgi:L-2-hydroxyglutarate oxidase LhgO
MEQVDAVVIGAGVVGLAVARALALAGREVLVLEAAGAIGTETSSRNSEVIHAGIYYPAGTLKARLCVEGRRRLYAYCAERGIAARAIGKLLVASRDEQVPKLAALKETGERNGVDDLRWIDREEARELEPEVVCVRGLFSPSSGIVDSHAYMLSLQGDLEAAGGVIAFNAPVIRGAVSPSGHELEVGGADPLALRARLVVNAAGLRAPEIARALRGMPGEVVPPGYFAKGNYFALSGVRSPFRHLVYPMPEQAGLGIHATLDLSGQVRFGPPGAGGALLRVDPELLAGAPGRQPRPDLLRHPPQDRGARRAGLGLRDPGPGPARRRGAVAPVRDRIARPDRLARHRGRARRRGGRVAAGGLTRLSGGRDPACARAGPAGSGATPRR